MTDELEVPSAYSPIVILPEVTIPDESIEERRLTMRAHKRAINWVLAQRPVSQSPNMNALFPLARHLLEAVDLYTETLDPYDDMRRARADIIEYYRAHPDADGFRQVLGVSEEWFDDLFEEAIAVERNA